MHSLSTRPISQNLGTYLEITRTQTITALNEWAGWRNVVVYRLAKKMIVSFSRARSPFKTTGSAPTNWSAC